jgi:glycosyltransferase involved in cell wall biosynthesis
MSCRVPILASAVQGIPELVRPDLEAVLVPPGDTSQWADALALMLSAPAANAPLAARARARVENCFSDTQLLPHHLALISATAASGPVRSVSAP